MRECRTCDTIMENFKEFVNTLKQFTVSPKTKEPESVDQAVEDLRVLNELAKKYKESK
jgi:hypothetical protein